MRILSVALLGIVTSVGLFGQTVAPPQTHLKVGDVAPDFSLPSTQGGRVSLSDFSGKTTVVLAFFPAAFTGG
jgi:peroxiredoxin